MQYTGTMQVTTNPFSTMSSEPTPNQPSIFPGEVFTNTAEFDSGIRQLLPRYDDLLDGLARCVPATATQVLELGCGTGELSLRLLAHCPQAQLVAMDYSPRMLDFARSKADRAGYGDRVRWVEGDFGAWAIGDDLGERAIALDPFSDKASSHNTGFDACVSSLAIHHLSDDMKVKLFAKIQGVLRPGGYFWNGDPVLPESAEVADIHQAVRDAWAREQGSTLADIRARLGMGGSTAHGYSGQDRLATLSDHLQWLKDTGFAGVAVPWKYYGLALFGGWTPTN